MGRFAETTGPCPTADAAADERDEEVVNRIFAAGLALRSAATLTDSSGAVRHLTRAMAELDDALRELRKAAFRRVTTREQE